MHDADTISQLLNVLSAPYAFIGLCVGILMLIIFGLPLLERPLPRRRRRSS